MNLILSKHRGSYLGFINVLNPWQAIALTVYARHIWYDLLANFVEDARPTLMNGQGAIDWILGKTHEEHNFIGVSDISDISTAYYQNMSPVLAFLGADNAFITRWGGELYRDNFNFSIQYP